MIPALAELCADAGGPAIEMDRTGQWPAEQFRLCGEAGVFEWFLDPAWGGQAWSDEASRSRLPRPQLPPASRPRSS